MRFADVEWLFGLLGAALFAALLIASGVLLVRARRRFGDEARVAALGSAATGTLRAVKGSLLVVAVALVFVAAARPQYGQGERTVPATNLDVVLVLDYSKSMYARDVAPSRIARAKLEVAELVRRLPGARFGAVAFAGDAISFPLTSDGGAVAQYFRQLQPNDMPVGGTAIARALHRSLELLERDPVSKEHAKVIVLVTDGEDLEGDPVGVAKRAAELGVRIDVVQIGGRTPEPIPEVDERGQVTGLRHDDSGRPMTTSLSAEGEKTLVEIAEVTGGAIARSAEGRTGIEEVAARLRRLMSDELSERVETVYGEVYGWPLGLAVLLLIVEAFLGLRPAVRRPPPPPEQRRGFRTRHGALGAEGRRATVTSLAALVLAAAALASVGCSSAVDPLFVRHDPVVERALAALRAGDATAARSLLADHLGAGECTPEGIDLPGDLARRPHATYDLALALAAEAEAHGLKLGDFGPAQLGATQAPPSGAAGVDAREQTAACALAVLTRLLEDPSVPTETRVRALVTAGNLEVLRGQPKDALAHYDAALRLSPGRGEPDDVASVGRDAAWNRAIALVLSEAEQEPDDPKSEQQPPSDQDQQSDQSGAGSPSPSAAPPDPSAAPSAGSSGAPPPSAAPPDSSAAPSGAGSAASPPPEPSESGQPSDSQASEGATGEPPPSDGTEPAAPAEPRDGAAAAAAEPGTDEPTADAEMYDAILDRLAGAPTLQQHDARRRAAQTRRRPRAEDK